MSLYSESLVSLASLYVDFLRERPKTRLYLIITFLFLSVTLLLLGIFAYYLFIPGVADTLKNIFLIGATIMGAWFLLSILSFTKVKFSASGISLELESIRSERERIKKRLSAKTDQNIFDTIQLSLNQLTEYYTINKSQARNSYRWSVFGILVGFITLVAGSWLIFFQENPKIEIAIITGISGILIEFLGATNFYIYKKSLTQLNYFFEELIKMQDTMLAIGICNELKQENKKLELQEFIIKTLVNRSSKSMLFIQGNGNKVTTDAEVVGNIGS